MLLCSYAKKIKVIYNEKSEINTDEVKQEIKRLIIWQCLKNKINSLNIISK